MNEQQQGFQIENLSFSYPGEKKLIKQLDLHLEKGKITAILGANGCGKSTLFRLIGGLYPPEQGRILLNGKNISAISKREYAKQVAIVHQNNTAPLDLTVKKLVCFGRTPYQHLWSGLSSTDQEAVEWALTITNTLQYANIPISHLSGGERQRVWLAMAIAQATGVLLLDEITTYLDIYYQYELLQMLNQLNREKGITIIMIAHDLNHALTFCDNTVLMKDGTVLATGKTEEVIIPQLIEQTFAIKSEIVVIDKKAYCIYSDQERVFLNEQHKA